MSFRNLEKLKRDICRIERKLMPYRYWPPGQTEWPEFHEAWWVTNPESFRKYAERTNDSQMKGIMENPPRPDHKQFREWAEGLMAHLRARESAKNQVQT